MRAEFRLPGATGGSIAMKAEAYEAWYSSPRGQWIADTEFALLKSVLRPAPGCSLLDIGCGTGQFTRRFAREINGPVVGVDPDLEWLSYANAHRHGHEYYVAGKAEQLPFADRSFDCTISVATFCFITDQVQALRELVRVTRQRFVLGLFNRHSLLYLKKGRGGGRGGYKGAHWHTAAEIRGLLAKVGVEDVAVRAAIVLTGGSGFAKSVEKAWPRQILAGGFLAVAGRLPGVEQSASVGEGAD